MILLVALAMLMGAGKAYAQAPAIEAQVPSPSAIPPARKNLTKERTQEHRFWDKKNDWLFAGVGAARTFDYFSTLNLRRRGDREVLLTNEIVDNHAAFAAIGAAGTRGLVRGGIFFHYHGQYRVAQLCPVRP